MNQNKKVFIIIPALNPPKEFVEYVNSLIENNFKNILVINDGSSEEYKETFEKINQKKECFIINHEVNQGKGKSLKDALKYFFELPNKNEFLGVITVDCDGQHLVKDVIKIAEKMKENSDALILGARNCNKENVPLRSKFGNIAIAKTFKLLYGIDISDIVTGLRGIPKNIIEYIYDLNGDRYEFEPNMLIECSVRKIKIVEVPIETVYIDNNSGSHYRPVIDSLRIYLKLFNCFIKYSALSIISCMIDIVLFKIFLILLNIDVQNIKIILATIFARIISSFVNFILNKKVAFDSHKSIKSTILKYYILCITQMIISGILVSTIFSLINISEVVIKIIVDTILFFINFRVQRKFIFNE